MTAAATIQTRATKRADDVACDLLALVLKLLSCDRPPAADCRSAPMLKAYYDVAPEIVERQLQFRRTRNMARDSSYNSLASLDVVMDFIERRIEVDLEPNKPRHGTISSFEENCHQVTFDDRTDLWFHLDIDNLTASGYVQQMDRNEDGTFCMKGPRLKSRLI